MSSPLAFNPSRAQSRPLQAVPATARSLSAGQSPVLQLNSSSSDSSGGQQVPANPSIQDILQLFIQLFQQVFNLPQTDSQVPADGTTDGTTTSDEDPNVDNGGDTIDGVDTNTPGGRDTTAGTQPGTTDPNGGTGTGNGDTGNGDTTGTDTGNGDNTGTTGSDNQTQTQPQGGQPVNVALVEAGFYGQDGAQAQGNNGGDADQHAQEVANVYRDNGPGAGQVHYYKGNKNKPTDDSGSGDDLLHSQQDVDAYLDSTGAVIDQMTDQVNGIVQKGQDRVINGSLGLTRETLYTNVALSLIQDPKLAQTFGLKESDIKGIKKNKDGQFEVPDNVKNAVVGYVDKRLDAPDSAFNKSLQRYQAATKNAADHGVSVVVAAGNDHEQTQIFNGAKPGADINFLAESDNVITVAATDENGQVADFSSHGNGRFNPTVSARGVQVDTGVQHDDGNGNTTTLDDGTSFAAPEVAALVAKMYEANPNLSADQVKQILQQTATDAAPGAEADGAGNINPDKALELAKQTQGTRQDGGTGTAQPTGQPTGGTGSQPTSAGQTNGGNGVQSTSAGQTNSFIAAGQQPDTSKPKDKGTQAA